MFIVSWDIALAIGLYFIALAISILYYLSSKRYSETSDCGDG
ncbi:MAG: hypothetical protein QXN35_04440 [Ignisphaera sp.]